MASEQVDANTVALIAGDIVARTVSGPRAPYAGPGNLRPSEHDAIDWAVRVARGVAVEVERSGPNVWPAGKRGLGWMALALECQNCGHPEIVARADGATYCDHCAQAGRVAVVVAKGA